MNQQSEPTSSIHASACEVLIRLGSRMVAGFDKQCGPTVTYAQFRILSEVAEAGAGGVSPSTLAEKLMIERATVSAVSDRLVQAGLLDRTEGANRRTFNLAITEAGRAKWNALRPKTFSLADQAFLELTAKETALLSELFARIERRLRAAVPLGHDRER